MPPGQFEDHSNIGFAVDPAAVEHSRPQDSIKTALQELPVYLIGVATARIALILLRAQLCADLCRPCNEFGSGGHGSVYANSQR